MTPGAPAAATVAPAAAAGPPAPGAARPPVPGGAPPIPGGRGLTAENAPSLRLPGEHFVAAVAFLVLGAVGLVWIAPELAAGLHASPRVAGVAHLFTLGWLTTTIFGALYQLLPVALGARVTSERLGHASFVCHVAGVALLAGGLILFRPVAMHTGIGFLTLGIVLAVANYATMLPRAITRDVTWAAVATSLSFLVLTLILGALLATDLTTGVLGGLKAHVLVVHFHIAAIGWVLLTIVGMSHRLFPMFLLAHGADTSWSRRALVLLAVGLLALCVGLDLGSAIVTWSAAAVLEGGVACFYVQASRFYRAKRRPMLDTGLRHAGLGLACFAAAAVLAPAVLAAGASHPRLATAYVFLGIGGGLSIFVVGFFYKIVPFLAWLARFRTEMGKRAVPAIADLYSARIARVELALFAGAIPVLAAGVLSGSTLVVRAGAIAFAAAVLLFAWQLAGVMWREPAS